MDLKRMLSSVNRRIEAALTLICLLSFSDLVSQKNEFNINNFSSWTTETKQQKLFFFNGNKKSIGYFVVYTNNKGTWVVPIKRHVYYFINGLAKQIINYTDQGYLSSDTLYKRNGKIKKIKHFTHD
jgi:hypothetical protein